MFDYPVLLNLGVDSPHLFAIWLRSQQPDITDDLFQFLVSDFTDFLFYESTLCN